MSREVEEKRSRKEVGEKRLLLFSRWERRVLCALYTLIRTGGSALRIFDEGKGGAGKCQGRGYRSVVIVLSLCCRLIILALQL